MDYTKIETWLLENLCEDRYVHSLGVAECAKRLAEKFNIDAEKAYYTGLLHDCAKCMDKDETQKILKQLDLVEGELCNPKTHHAPVGAYIAQKEFGITDSEILSAIRWHTLGKVDMTHFEKIIFLSDKIEERTRPREIYEPLRIILEKEGLNAAILQCYKNTIESLVARNLTICPLTIEIYNNLLSN